MFLESNQTQPSTPVWVSSEEEEDEEEDSEEDDEADGSVSSHHSSDDEWVEVESDYVENTLPFTGQFGFQPQKRPRDIFSLFLTDAIVDLIVGETNYYANSFLNGPTSSDATRVMFRRWTPVDQETIRKFLGLTMLMGFVKKPTISDYWELDTVTATPFVGP